MRRAKTLEELDEVRLRVRAIVAQDRDDYSPEDLTELREALEARKRDLEERVDMRMFYDLAPPGKWNTEMDWRTDRGQEDDGPGT